ncbi:probable histone-arginine methyltransferase 1.3 [Brassica rapa]|uniref:probable histone-arginine methyltransferase 1.3 n=1 Tax=Brassica campestris TaxID=3711 RepID=UPI00142E58C2|nr:probable histone-arginine methyltransferase 1.3 [Brassica rapa]XP_033129163.1 probable histone-arginine methyltransferase 1.3 [Brassica rapa]
MPSLSRVGSESSMSSSSRTGALRFTIQQNLIEDNVRAGAYYATVMKNKLDFAGCVVLHVGAGSGVLALCAAQAGAKHIYLVEASEYALKLIDENPTFSELITVIKGNVEDVQLPEKADVLISEPLGMCFTHGFNERGLKSYVIARDRFISPNGKMFPSAGRIHIAPFCDEFLFTEMANKPVVDAFDESVLVAHPMIHTLDFTQKKEGDFYVMDVPLLFISSTSTMVHGLALWFEVLLDGSVDKRWIKTSPRAPTTDCFRIRCVFPHAIDVVIGQTITGKARFEALSDHSYTTDITLTAEMFGRGGCKIGFQTNKSRFELGEAQKVTPLPPKDETIEDWYSQFQYGPIDNFHGFFLPWDMLEKFLSAQDAKSSEVVGILVGTEKNKVTHILLPPQWSRQGELHISDIPLENMHLQGTTLIGFVRTEESCEIALPTAADVRFLSKHFGKEAIVGICSATSTMAFYKLTEGFLETSWKLDENTSVLFLVPRGGIWNYNTCVNNRRKDMPYRLEVSRLPNAYLGC